MAITHYIDTSLPELARTRVKSLTDRVPEQFPVLIFGDTRNHNFVFHYQGAVESFSGNASYSLKVTLGNVKLSPTSGTYTLTCGSSATLNALSDAATIENALNDLTSIISAGGVTVSGEYPDFLITWKQVGIVTALTADATLLVPLSSVSLTTTQTGTASAVNQIALKLRQSAIVSQSTWTTITSPANGWTGTISTNTSGALTLLQTLGREVSGLLEVDTVITAQVLDSNAVPISYFQAPITLRASNLDANATVSPPLTTYTLGDILYGNSSGNLSRLAGNTTATQNFLTQTGTGTISAAPAWVAFSPGSAVWGAITGTLSNQTDLQTALNGKQATLTIGNFTESTSSVLTITGGTGAIIGSGLTVQVKQASGTVSGYLSSTDWTTFNNKGSGSVTSVGLSLPSIITVSGSPVTSSGTLTGTLATQVQKTFLAGPTSGVDATPTFRTIAVADVPTLNQNTTGTAAAWTTARLLAGNSVDGTANIAFANKFIVQGIADSGLSGAQFLGALSTGLVKNTITTGVLSIAAAATDYVAPSAYASTNGLTMATARLLGRTTAASGAAEEISVGTGLSLSAGSLSCTVAAPVGADPTATIGLSPVNGSAATFMRSDAAPQLNQALLLVRSFCHC